MNRIFAFSIVALASLAWGISASADTLSATLIKVRGIVTESTEGGGSTRLLTGAIVPVDHRVTVGRLGVAMYKLGDACVIKQEPQATLSFTRLSRTSTPEGHEAGVDLLLQKGEMYSDAMPAGHDRLNYTITTSKIEAFTRGAVFKVSHSYSTSIVSVREGIVEVRYCRGSKKCLVHAGEVFVVTDCEGVQRWFTDDELRQMTLFAALTGSAFGAELGLPMLHVAVLSPEVPPDLPMISP